MKTAFHQLDLTGRPPHEVADPSVWIGAAHRDALHDLRLPNGCPAGTLRAWLKACPALREITASRVEDDGSSIHTQVLPSLRYFRSDLPGPRGLILGPHTQVTVPHTDWWPTNARLLTRWISGAVRPPQLDEQVWRDVMLLVDPLISTPSSRYRRGLCIGGALRQAMTRLLWVVPQELLSGAAELNHRAVLTRLARATESLEMSYDEFKHFLQPQLKAAQEANSMMMPGGRCRQKNVRELQELASLRAWAQAAGTGEDPEVRRSVADLRHHYLRERACRLAAPLPPQHFADTQFTSVAPPCTSVDPPSRVEAATQTDDPTW